MEDKITRLDDNIVRVETTIPEKVIPESVEVKEYNLTYLEEEIDNLLKEAQNYEKQLSNTVAQLAEKQTLLATLKTAKPIEPLEIIR